MSEKENSLMKLQNNKNTALDANKTEQESDSNKHCDFETIEEYKEAILDIYLETAEKYRSARQMSCQCTHIADEIDAMRALLLEHNIKFTPQIPFVGKSGNNHWDDKSLFERNVVIRKSLRKSDNGMTFKMVTYGRDKPGNEQEKSITKKEAIEWLQSAGATEDEIFEITGDIPAAVTDGDFLPSDDK